MNPTAETKSPLEDERLVAAMDSLHKGVHDMHGKLKLGMNDHGVAPQSLVETLVKLQTQCLNLMQQQLFHTAIVDAMLDTLDTPTQEIVIENAVQGAAKIVEKLEAVAAKRRAAEKKPTIITPGAGMPIPKPPGL